LALNPEHPLFLPVLLLGNYDPLLLDLLVEIDDHLGILALAFVQVGELLLLAEQLLLEGGDGHVGTGATC